MTLRPPVIGFAPHVPSYAWDRIALSLVNAMQYLAALEAFTGEEQADYRVMLLRAREVASTQRAEAQARMAALFADDPAQFRRCENGLEPWPDEDATSFTGRCNCQDLCFHRFQADMTAAEWQERFGLAESMGEPWFRCNCPGVKPPCPVPGHPLDS